MKISKKSQLAMGVISLISVYLITCQLRSVEINTAADNAPEKMRTAELQSRLNAETEKNADLLSQLLEAQRNLERYRSEATDKSTANTIMKQELDASQILAGTTELEGSGVSVSLADSTLSEGTFASAEEYIIHDTDLRMVLTELFGAGAEAVSINGQRIIATTAVRCVGNTVMVNDVKIASPFIINAIGDSNTLEAALLIRGGAADYLKTWGITLTVEKKESVTVPRYGGIASFKYAKPKGGAQQ